LTARIVHQPAKGQGVGDSRALRDPNGGTNRPFGIPPDCGRTLAQPGWLPEGSRPRGAGERL